MIIEISNERLTARIESYGAELQSLVKKDGGREYVWYGRKDIWSGRSPLLFPIIGRLLDDKYVLDGKQYSLPKHGFARKNEFDGEKISENTAKFVFRQTPQTLEVYPFCFELEVTFELDDDQIKVTHNVRNTNDKQMYFSFGAHPAFNAENGVKIIFDEAETLSTIKVDEEGLRTGKEEKCLENSAELTIDKKTFLDDALIFENVKSTGGCLYEDGKKLLHFTWGNVPYLGFWAKPGAPYVCIEPWYGVNDSHEKKDDFSKKDGILKLLPDEEFSYSWSAEIF